MIKTSLSPPLISVIIPCYNHGKFLKKAVKSVQSQDITEVEIIVVDDGSTDNTFQVAENLAVHYIKQKNSGLSSARNTGIEQSNGDFLVFLDADDWLLPGSLETNRNILIEQPELAFVSGAHEKVFEKKGVTHEVFVTVNDNHYLRMLEGNYIGMHATVMYRSWVFDEFLFDPSLNMCEDYELYLRITQNYPVVHHTKKVAAYRFHASNMSDNTPNMLEAALSVLKRQKSHLTTNVEKQAYKNGLRFWVDYYTRKLYKDIQSKRKSFSFRNFKIFLKYKPIMIVRLVIKKLKSNINFIHL